MTANTTIAAAWCVTVSVELYAGVDFARISLTTHHGAGVVRVIYDGPASGAAPAALGAQLSEVA